MKLWKCTISRKEKGLSSIQWQQQSMNTDISPDSLNTFMILCTVDDEVFKVFTILLWRTLSWNCFTICSSAEVNLRLGPASLNVVGDNDGAAARAMTEVEDETAEMWQGGCVSWEGGRRGGCWAGLWTEPYEEWVQLILAVPTSIFLILLLLEACVLLHSWPHISYVALLKLVLQLSPVNLLVISNLHFQLFLYWP